MNKIDELYIKTGNARIYKTMTGHSPYAGLMIQRSFRVHNRLFSTTVERSNALYERLRAGDV